MNEIHVTEESRFCRLLIVSNRLPVVLDRTKADEWTLKPGSGGLVTALEPILHRTEGLWMGWPGIPADSIDGEVLDGILARHSGSQGYEVRGVPLTAEEEEGFYLGFSNQVVWPLFHGFHGRCNFDPSFWDVYRGVNRKFAEAVARQAREGDFIWIHDYHLMGVAEELRDRGVTLPMGFFLHIPFPALDLFLKLPWRFPVLRSLLHYDLLGFQAARDREGFLQAVRTLVPEAEIEEDDGRVASPMRTVATLRAGVFPISIDYSEFANAADTEPVRERARQIREALENPAGDSPQRTEMFLGVDRLDYSKGIPQKLKGFRQALRRHPELRGRVTLVQLVVPSREDVPEYREMKDEIERLVGEISGEFTRPGWSPVHYQYGRWDRTELIAHYRAARGALVTPLKDGMNLVAKEFCASSADGDGVLILSEHAGAAAQLQKGALMVNPYDMDDVASAIHRAYTMEEEECRRRMAHLREQVRDWDIHWWVRTFLEAAQGRDLGPDQDLHLPRYIPAPPEDFLAGL